MLNCVKHITEYGLDSLTDLGIEIKDYGDFVLLNYSQIDSPKFNPIVDECRGLILAKGTWKVLCRSFDRFYNYGEDPRSNEFPIGLASVSEKVDGSLIRFWFNPFLGEWCAATRKMAFAEGPVTNGTCTFKNIVERITGDINAYFEEDLELQGYTIICELVSPETRVVKPYGETALYYLGMRDNDNGIYFEVPDKAPDGRYDFSWYFTGMKRPKLYKFNSFEDCDKAIAELPTFDEGYVANYNDWRIKIKSPAYLAIAHLRNNGAMSIKRIVSLVMRNDEEEYLSYFPEDREIFQPWIDARRTLRFVVDSTFEECKHIKDQKEFALRVKDLHYAGILFQMRKGCTYVEIIERMINGSKASDGLVELLTGW